MPEADISTARAAVRQSAADVGALLRSVKQPSAPALGEWTVAELAAHLSHSLDVVGAMAQGGGALVTDMWDLSATTRMLVAGEAERDPSQLADRIEASARRLSDDAGDAQETFSWVLAGVNVPLSVLVCHALNELIVHGYDLATADGRRWKVNRDHSALVLTGFLFPIAARLGGVMVDKAAAAGVRTCMDIRLRGGRGRAVFCFDDGDLTVTPAPTGPVDCHLSVDPAAFLLVAWGRVSQWGPMARGQLAAWGRRPWMGLKLRSLMRNP